MIARSIIVLGVGIWIYLTSPVGSVAFQKEEMGLKVGEKVPSFHLKDQNGKLQNLGDFLKKGKVALVFYRSAKW